jgi:hypothetical protein
MNDYLLQWLIYNEGKSFASPRKHVFGSRAQAFRLQSVDQVGKRTIIKPEKSGSNSIELYFWMFEKTLELLQRLPGIPKPLGSRIKPPYMKLSVEDAIWRKPFTDVEDEYLASPFICDLLYYSGLIDYTYTRNPETGNKVQGAILSKALREHVN